MMLDQAPLGVSTIRLTVNGETITVAADPFASLANTLRDDLGLIGTKIGCDAGDCGACTVRIDGEQACACMVSTGQAEDAEIETVEGPGPDGITEKLRKAFLAHGAAQCGICTPGMLMAATDHLARNSATSRPEIEDALGGVLCRCTGYLKIVEAIMDVANGSVLETPRAEGGNAVGARIARTGVRLINSGGRPGRRVTVLGVTFKENVPDIRNSKVVDVIRELQQFGMEVTVADCMADAGEVRHEYGFDLVDEADPVGLRRIDRLAGEEHAPERALRNEPAGMRGAPEAPYVDCRQAECRVLGGDADVAERREHAARAERRLQRGRLAETGRQHADHQHLVVSCRREPCPSDGTLNGNRAKFRSGLARKNPLKTAHRRPRRADDDHGVRFMTGL